MSFANTAWMPGNRTYHFGIPGGILLPSAARRNCCRRMCGIGIRQGLSHSDDHYTAVMFDELAARADWAILPAADCNHAPVIKAENLDLTAKVGETVTLSASSEDPDGNDMTASWCIPVASCTYGREEAANDGGSWGGSQVVNEKATLRTLSATEGFETALTIP